MVVGHFHRNSPREKWAKRGGGPFSPKNTYIRNPFFVSSGPGASVVWAWGAKLARRQISGGPFSPKFPARDSDVWASFATDRVSESKNRNSFPNYIIFLKISFRLSFRLYKKLHGLSVTLVL